MGIEGRGLGPRRIAKERSHNQREIDEQADDADRASGDRGVEDFALSDSSHGTQILTESWIPEKTVVEGCRGLGPSDRHLACQAKNPAC